MRKTKKLIGAALSVALCASMLTGCGNQKTGNENENGTETKTETAADTGKKTMVIGDTTFNSSNEENNVNPHDAFPDGPVSDMVLVKPW